MISAISLDSSATVVRLAIVFLMERTQTVRRFQRLSGLSLIYIPGTFSRHS
jgi:hypothetical protein